MLQALILALALIGQTAIADDSRGLTVLDFHATWCGPCKTQRPRIESLKKAGYPIKTVDIDADKATAKRYQVEAVPTLVLIDRDGNTLSRRVGPYSANEIAAWYKVEFRKLGPIEEPAEDPRAARPPPAQTPDSWLTSCRIVMLKVTSNGDQPACYGSGTVIGSTDDEAIVLTCAHIFAPGNEKSVPAKDFPGKIQINLSDGIPVDDGKARGKHSGFSKNYDGSPIDYDFGMDVGLVRIATKDKLPFSRVVPPSWKPAAGMAMHVVGCAEAQYPTQFTTKIRNPNHGAPGEVYLAIQCDRSPAQGRSGGGLFTEDGLLAGVTDFQSPTDNSGLYAHPKSIYAILDRNDLSDLYREVAQVRKPKATPAPAPEVEVDRDSKLRKMVEETCKLFHRKPPVPGAKGDKGDPGEKGDTGATGATGANGKDGKNGVDGKAGANGKDGVNPSGTPVDLSAILKRLKALEEEVAKPITVEMKLPGGQVVTHDFHRKPNTDGITGIGAGFPNLKLGFDFSHFAVPTKTPSTSPTKG